MDIKGFKLKVRINRKLCLALSGVQTLRKFFHYFLCELIEICTFSMEAFVD